MTSLEYRHGTAYFQHKPAHVSLSSSTTVYNKINNCMKVIKKQIVTSLVNKIVHTFQASTVCTNVLIVRQTQATWVLESFNFFNSKYRKTIHIYYDITVIPKHNVTYWNIPSFLITIKYVNSMYLGDTVSPGSTKLTVTNYVFNFKRVLRREIKGLSTKTTLGIYPYANQTRLVF